MEENIWLKDLDNRLKALEIQQITAEINRRGKAARTGAYLDVLTRANIETLQEAIRMSKSVLTLEKVFEEAGLVAKWEARGEARGKAEGKAEGKLEIAQKMKAAGRPLAEITEFTGIELN